MIESLAGWIRHLILLLIAAALVDMALPRGDLRRYVDVIVGLVILATILSPLFSWLGGDLDGKMEQALAALGRQWDDSPSPRVTGGVKEPSTLGAAVSREETERLFAQSLADHIQQGLSAHVGVPVQRVEVGLAADPSPGEGAQSGGMSALPPIDEVIVWLEADSGEHDRESGAVTPVTPITPIRISVQRPSWSSDSPFPTGDVGQWRNLIREWLSANLGVNPSHIGVLVAP